MSQKTTGPVDIYFRGGGRDQDTTHGSGICSRDNMIVEGECPNATTIDTRHRTITNRTMMKTTIFE